MKHKSRIVSSTIEGEKRSEAKLEKRRITYEIMAPGNEMSWCWLPRGGYNNPDLVTVSLVGCMHAMNIEETGLIKSFPRLWQMCARFGDPVIPRLFKVTYEIH